MDDMFSRISALLDNPEQAEKIKQLAASFVKDESNKTTAPAAETAPGETLATAMTSTAMPQQLGNLLSGASHSRDVSLLNAIRPYMRKSRADKLSSAIKAMEMIEIFSKLK